MRNFKQLWTYENDVEIKKIKKKYIKDKKMTAKLRKYFIDEVIESLTPKLQWRKDLTDEESKICSNVKWPSTGDCRSLYIEGWNMLLIH